MTVPIRQPLEPHPDAPRRIFYEIIFEADTPAGKWFDVLLLWAIVGSVFAVMLESVTSVRLAHGGLLRGAEWGFTLLFTGEYVLRLWCVRRPARYALSFLGVIDFLAIIPTYLSLAIAGTQSLLVIRALRLLRVFRILKLARFLGEFNALLKALRRSRDRIVVFLCALLTLTVIMGTVMYLIEGERSGFTSIPRSIYWAIVTMTTVGYGDIAPRTVPGQVMASVIMIMGYAIIVVPSGIFSVELARAVQPDASAAGARCPHCGQDISSPPRA